MKRETKAYIAILDQQDRHGKGWYSGTGATRKLTDAEAKPLLEAGKIRLVDLTPKRWVILTEGDKTKKISWGDYLKMRIKNRK